MNKKVAVIWDWNGTLVNDAFVFVDIMNVFLSERGLNPITIDDYRDCFEFPIENYYKNLGFNFKKESFQEVGSLFIKKYKKERFKAFFYPNIKKLLFFLKSNEVPQFVVSAQENSLLKSAVTHYKVGDLFVDFKGVDNINARGKVQAAKKIIKKHLNNNYKIIVIGDTLYDHKVAKAVGAETLLVSFGHYSKKRLLGQDVDIVDTVSDLKKWFNQKLFC